MLADRNINFHSFEDREVFAVNLLTTLSDVLQTTVGLDDAEGFIAMVAHQLGGELSQSLDEQSDAPLTLADIAEALLTLKHRIGGGFRVVTLSPDYLILENDRCPFGKSVEGRESLCRMTSGVFGRIVADQLGYANVAIPRSIALGHNGCRVEIHLVQGAGPDNGIDYFSTREVTHVM